MMCIALSGSNIDMPATGSIGRKSITHDPFILNLRKWMIKLESDMFIIHAVIIKVCHGGDLGQL